MYHPIRGWKPTTPPLTASNFEAVCDTHRNVAIHFWAEWNGVDPPFDRAIRKLPSEISALVHFMSCDTDDPQNDSLCKLFAIGTIPSLAIVVNGKFDSLIVGQRSSEELVPELINRFSLPIAKTITDTRQIAKFGKVSRLACVFKWLRSRFWPREH
ncbi:MAG: thioredoxin family protein [Pirellula sp.]|jgi:hypothetical protein